MEIIELIIILVVWGIYKLVESSQPVNKHAFTREELDEMTTRMIGKSQRECAAILKEYEKY